MTESLDDRQLAREREALLIDADTAEVDWCYGQVADPYGELDLPPECDCVGRMYFARRPGSDIWVSFYDLPKATREKLWDKCPVAFSVSVKVADS